MSISILKLFKDNIHDKSAVQAITNRLAILLFRGSKYPDLMTTFLNEYYEIRVGLDTEQTKILDRSLFSEYKTISKNYIPGGYNE